MQNWRNKVKTNIEVLRLAPARVEGRLKCNQAGGRICDNDRREPLHFMRGRFDRLLNPTDPRRLCSTDSFATKQEGARLTSSYRADKAINILLRIGNAAPRGWYCEKRVFTGDSDVARERQFNAGSPITAVDRRHCGKMQVVDGSGAGRIASRNKAPLQRPLSALPFRVNRSQHKNC